MLETLGLIGIGAVIGIAKERFHQARADNLTIKQTTTHMLRGYTREVEGIAHIVGIKTVKTENGKKIILRIKLPKIKKAEAIKIVEEEPTLSPA